MNLPALTEIEAAAEIVHRTLPPTPLIRWPLLCERTEAEVWIKHENHTPVGAFKLRGGLVYMDRPRRDAPAVRGVVAATRGNHGQSIAFAARASGIARRDRRAARQQPGEERRRARAGCAVAGAGPRLSRSLRGGRTDCGGGIAAPGPILRCKFAVRGGDVRVELFRTGPEFDAVYAPIGLGSGICGTIAVRNALGLKTEVIGVCAAGASAYARSFAEGRRVATETAETVADGMACRTPHADAVAIINKNASRIVTVEDAEIRFAMQCLFSDTHNAAEGAGAAAVAAILRERATVRGRRVAAILTGGNVDREVFARILADG